MRVPATICFAGAEAEVCLERNSFPIWVLPQGIPRPAATGGQYCQPGARPAGAESGPGFYLSARIAPTEPVALFQDAKLAQDASTGRPQFTQGGACAFILI